MKGFAKKSTICVAIQDMMELGIKGVFVAEGTF